MHISALSHAHFKTLSPCLVIKSQCAVPMGWLGTFKPACPVWTACIPLISRGLYAMCSTCVSWFTNPSVRLAGKQRDGQLSSITVAGARRRWWCRLDPLPGWGQRQRWGLDQAGQGGQLLHQVPLQRPQDQCQACLQGVCCQCCWHRQTTGVTAGHTSQTSRWVEHFMLLLAV